MASRKNLNCSSLQSCMSYMQRLHVQDGVLDAKIVETMHLDNEAFVSFAWWAGQSWCCGWSYIDSNIDLIKPDKIVNLPDIKNFDFVGDKAIYNIYQATEDLFPDRYPSVISALETDYKRSGLASSFESLQLANSDTGKVVKIGRVNRRQRWHQG